MAVSRNRRVIFDRVVGRQIGEVDRRVVVQHVQPGVGHADRQNTGQVVGYVAPPTEVNELVDIALPDILPILLLRANSGSLRLSRGKQSEVAESLAVRRKLGWKARSIRNVGACRVSANYEPQRVSIACLVLQIAKCGDRVSRIVGGLVVRLRRLNRVARGPRREVEQIREASGLLTRVIRQSIPLPQLPAKGDAAVKRIPTSTFGANVGERLDRT